MTKTILILGAGKSAFNLISYLADNSQKLEIEINLSRAGKYWAQNCWKRIGKKKCLSGINIKRVSIGN